MKKIYIFTTSSDVKRETKEVLSASYEPICFSEEDKLCYEIASEQNPVVIFHADSYPQDKSLFADKLLRANPSTLMLVIANVPNIGDGVALLKRGAKGYINAFSAHDFFAQAVETVSSGNIWVHPALMKYIIQHMAPTEEADKAALESLTPIELEISKLVTTGLSNKEIAQSLDKAEITVKKHLSTIFQKLSINDRLELALLFK